MSIISAKNIFKIFLLLLVHFNIQVNAQADYDTENDFTFIFITDIHIQTERHAVEGFMKAIDHINKLNPDFVLTGGDLVYDVLGVGYERADSLYNLYLETINLIDAPVYNTIGNHEIFGWDVESGISRDHSEFGKRMFEKRIGATYYSFDFQGYKFFILDSIEEVPEGGKYFGSINEQQISWLKTELSALDKNIPIIISTHIPFITTFSQIKAGSQKENERGLVIENSKEVLDLFNEYNLKLVLQGHLHYFEDINIQNDIRFITGGAVSARWWTGLRDGLEEGFLFIKVKGEEINAEYIDYGWEVQ